MIKNIKRYIKYMEDKKAIYFSILIVTLAVSTFIEIFYSYMYKLLFNSIEYSNWNLFKIACIMCLCVVVLRYLQPYLRYFQIKQVRKIVFKIKIDMFEKLSRLNMEYFEAHHSGDTLKRLNWDANSLKDSYFSHVFRILSLLLRGLAAIFTMILFNVKLAFISICFSIISVFISIWINKIIEKMSHEIQKNISKLTERLCDLLSGFLVIKMYDGSSIVTEKYLMENQNVKKGMEGQIRVLSFLEMISFLIGMLGNFGTILVGVVLVIRHEIDYGTVMGVVTLQMSVSNMFQFFGSALGNFTASIAEAQRVFDFLEQDQVEIKSGVAGIVPSDIVPNYIIPDYSKGIQIENLTFSYKNRAEVLKDFNLNIHNQEKIMVLGESGCGKSSLLKVLLRFYEKESGTIRIFGHEIESYQLYQLRNMITYVPQDSYLFDGTIAENIMYGNKNVQMDQVLKAAEMAYAKEFIDEMPDGFKTMLTSGGKNLSGGQRQRIAIARAFLKNAPIILLDEPSSALDVESENKINLAMKQLMANKIVIMVTHRTTAYEHFDRVVEMN